MTRQALKSVWIFIIPLLLLFAAACGGDDPTEAPAATDTPSATTSPAATSPPLPPRLQAQPQRRNLRRLPLRLLRRQPRRHRPPLPRHLQKNSMSLQPVISWPTGCGKWAETELKCSRCCPPTPTHTPTSQAPRTLPVLPMPTWFSASDCSSRAVGWRNCSKMPPRPRRHHRRGRCR